jgi:hypothetical protein
MIGWVLRPVPRIGIFNSPRCQDNGTARRAVLFCPLPGRVQMRGASALLLPPGFSMVVPSAILESMLWQQSCTTKLVGVGSCGTVVRRPERPSAGPINRFWSPDAV